MGVYETLAKVQADIAVPKSRTNKFGGYSYRNAEDIMEAVKPACLKHGAAFFVFDEIVKFDCEEHFSSTVEDKKRGTETTTNIDTMGRFYVKATAVFCADGERVEVSAFARETIAKKGMDEAQVTGSASSYARKYALCGLFGIDGQDDLDAMDNRDHVKQKTKNIKQPDKPKPATQQQAEAINEVCAMLDGVKDKSAADWMNAALESAAAKSAGVSPKTELTEQQAGVVLEQLRHWADSMGVRY